jgi:hypothetical protein
MAKQRKGKSKDRDGKLKSIGALWRTKPGSKVALAGKLQLEGKDGPSVDVLVFKNDKGDNPKRPDFRLVMVVEAEGGDDQDGTEGATGGQSGGDDDIPF